MADYARLARTARRLIEKNGRTVKLRRLSTEPEDPTKPWRARDVEEDVEIEVIAVILDYDLTERENDQVRRGDKRAFVAALSAVEEGEDPEPDVPADLRLYDKMVDGNEVWDIVNIETLEPADVRVLYDLQLRQ